jgi:hypothetical protein
MRQVRYVPVNRWKRLHWRWMRSYAYDSQDDKAVAVVEHSPDPDVRLMGEKRGVGASTRGEVHVGALCLQ